MCISSNIFPISFPHLDPTQSIAKPKTNQAHFHQRSLFFQIPINQMDLHAMYHKYPFKSPISKPSLPSFFPSQLKLFFPSSSFHLYSLFLFLPTQTIEDGACGARWADFIFFLHSIYYKPSSSWIVSIENDFFQIIFPCLK